MKKILFVYNPVAGTGAINNYIKQFKKTISDRGDTCSFYQTKGHEKDEKLLSKKLEEGFDQIICSGGDGTMNDVISILVKNRCTVPLALIPAGSTNDYTHSLGISRDPEEAFNAAIEAKNITKVDVGNLEGKTFMYVAAFGAFTKTTYTTPQKLKNKLGYFAYLLSAVSQLFSLPVCELKITAGEKTIKGKFIDGIVSNSHFVGGFKVVNDEKASMNDGLLEVLLIKKPKTFFGLFPIASSFLSGKIRKRQMIAFQAKSLEIEDCTGKGIDWNLDGEFGGSYAKSTIRIEEHRLTIIT